MIASGADCPPAILRVVKELAGRPVAEVVLISPHPLPECTARLAEVTSAAGRRQFLTGRTAGRPEPRFRGAVGQGSVRLARFERTINRGSFFARLRGTLQPIADGTTRLDATIWPAYSRMFGVGFLGYLTLFLLGYEAVAIGVVVRGHTHAWPLLLAPVLIALFIVGLFRWGLGALRTDAARLVDEIAAVLDANSLAQPRPTP